MTRAVTEVSEIYSALVLAQERAGVVINDLVIKGSSPHEPDVRIARARTIVAESKAPLFSAGLALLVESSTLSGPFPMPASSEVIQKGAEVSRKIREAFFWRLKSVFRLAHTSGQSIRFVKHRAVLPEKDWPLDKALAGASTQALASFLFELLLLSRVDPVDEPAPEPAAKLSIEEALGVPSDLFGIHPAGSGEPSRSASPGPVPSSLPPSVYQRAEEPVKAIKAQVPAVGAVSPNGTPGTSSPAAGSAPATGAAVPSPSAAATVKASVDPAPAQNQDTHSGSSAIEGRGGAALSSEAGCSKPEVARGNGRAPSTPLENSAGASPANAVESTRKTGEGTAVTTKAGGTVSQASVTLFDAKCMHAPDNGKDTESVAVLIPEQASKPVPASGSAGIGGSPVESSGAGNRERLPMNGEACSSAKLPVAGRTEPTTPAPAGQLERQASAVACDEDGGGSNAPESELVEREAPALASEADRRPVEAPAHAPSGSLSVDDVLARIGYEPGSEQLATEALAKPDHESLSQLSTEILTRAAAVHGKELVDEAFKKAGGTWSNGKVRPKRNHLLRRELPAFVLGLAARFKRPEKPAPPKAAKGPDPLVSDAVQQLAGGEIPW